MGRGPMCWIINYLRVPVGEMRFEREVNAITPKLGELREVTSPL